MVDQETGVRGYLLGARDTFLEPYTNGARATAVPFRGLDALAASDAGANVRDDLALVRRRIAEWRSRLRAAGDRAGPARRPQRRRRGGRDRGQAPLRCRARRVPAPRRQPRGRARRRPRRPRPRRVPAELRPGVRHGRAPRHARRRRRDRAQPGRAPARAPHRSGPRRRRRGAAPPGGAGRPEGRRSPWATTSRRCACGSSRELEAVEKAQAELDAQAEELRARTPSSSSSPTSPRTTCRSRCARSRASARCSSAATAASSTSAPTSTSRSPWTARSGCRC